MVEAESNTGVPEGNFDPNAKGCLFSFVQGITGFYNGAKQRYEYAKAFYNQPLEAQEAEVATMIQQAEYQAGVVLAAQEAGIILPEEIIDDTFIRSHQPNPLYGAILDQTLGNRINEVKQRNLEELLREFQEGIASATQEEIKEWTDSLSDKSSNYP